VTKVLFICEHGSSKSVIAAAHFARIAHEHGLDSDPTSRGTNPDESFPPHVVAGLEADGLAPLEDSPRELTEQDFVEAALRKEYIKAYEDCFKHCDKVKWNIVPADQNWYKEYVVATTLRDELKQLNMQYPGLKK